MDAVIDDRKPLMAPDMIQQLEDNLGYFVGCTLGRDDGLELRDNIIDTGSQRYGASSEQHADQTNNQVDVFLEVSLMVLHPPKRRMIESEILENEVPWNKSDRLTGVHPVS